MITCRTAEIRITPLIAHTSKIANIARGFTAATTAWTAMLGDLNVPSATKITSSDIIPRTSVLANHVGMISVISSTAVTVSMDARIAWDV